MANTIKIGNLEIDNLKVGTLSVDALYIGDVKIYPSTPTPPTPTLKWVSYSEGDAIPSDDVYNTYGLKIPTQVLYDMFDNGKELSIEFHSEELDHEHHPESVITFALYEWQILFTIGGESPTISYDPERDEYLEIIFSDYGVNYNYNVTSFNYGEQGDTEIVSDFPIDMDLYEEDTPTPQTLQWVTFNNGDTIPSDLDVYGVSGISQDLLSTYGGSGGGSGSYIIFEPSKNRVEYYVYDSEGSDCASGNELKTDPIEIIFSNRGCTDFINQGATVSGTIQLYIYA